MASLNSTSFNGAARDKKSEIRLYGGGPLWCVRSKERALGDGLGPMLEEKFLTSMLKSRGDFMAFFERPVAGTLGVVTIRLCRS